MALEEWQPKSQLGKAVASGVITSIDEVLAGGQPILEPQIVDKLLPDLKTEVFERRAVQRMSASGRKQRWRIAVVVGNRRGYVGVGVGRSAVLREAVADAERDAKKAIKHILLGCGSWECRCGEPHSIPFRVVGKSGSLRIILKPAPRGVGIVAGKVAKRVLALAGVKDVWTFSKGRTRNVLNVINALSNAFTALTSTKVGK